MKLYEDTGIMYSFLEDEFLENDLGEAFTYWDELYAIWDIEHFPNAKMITPTDIDNPWKLFVKLKRASKVIIYEWVEPNNVIH